ncbi:MAG: hypothetical protein KME12_11055 [Trichocoleus desertorum ATA4-8-CV12]|nr:hypothetical protein [Trichocoleus desertorum ATA4-8-CV12]
MPHRNFDSYRTQHLADLEWPANPEVQAQIAALQNSSSSHSKMLNLNAWAIAKTMDKFYPGFWNRFMANRQVALQQFLEQKRHQTAQNPGSTPPSASLEIPETSS